MTGRADRASKRSDTEAVRHAMERATRKGRPRSFYLNVRRGEGYVRMGTECRKDFSTYAQRDARACVRIRRDYQAEPAYRSIVMLDKPDSMSMNIRFAVSS